jgi:Tetratricopeptide repeat
VAAEFEPDGVDSAVLAELARLWRKASQRGTPERKTVKQRLLAKEAEVPVTTVNSWATGRNLPGDHEPLYRVGRVLTRWAGEPEQTQQQWATRLAIDRVRQAARHSEPPGPRAGFPTQLPPLPESLAGRDGLLAELHARLSNGPEPRRVVLHGLGGAGKTSVAVEYAHRHLAEVGVCWQLPAERPELLTEEFGKLAAELGLRQQDDARDPVASVHGALRHATRPWLLIFDNVVDQAAITRFIPPAGKGRVLVTTQSQHWPRGQGLAVPVLETGVAARFLVSRTGDQDQAAARELAEELGGLPLALQQAAAFMWTTQTPLAGYLPLFRGRQAELLNRGEALGHPLRVDATLRLALSRIGEEAPAAVGLSWLLALLAPEPVPLGLLLARAGAGDQLDQEAAVALGPLLGDPLAVKDAIAALRRYSLVTPAGDGLVLVHRLVQAVTRGQVPAGSAVTWRGAAAALVEAALPAQPEDPATWPACAALLPHARAVLDLTSDGMDKVARYLESAGRKRAVLDLCQLIVDACLASSAYGPGHPRTLAARHYFALVSATVDNPTVARDQFAAVLADRSRVLGPDDPDTLTTRHELARWTGWSGQSQRAIELVTALVADRERVLGPEHPDTLNSRAELARRTHGAGDPAGARDQLAALLPLRVKVQGPEHPDTLVTRHNLADWTGEAGDAGRAREQLAALLPVRRRVLGPDHPGTLATRRELAQWAGRAGDVTGAVDQLTALLPDYARVEGPEHRDTLFIRLVLADWTGTAGHAAGARDQLAALLPVYEKVLGPRHPHPVYNRERLAYWTGRAGQDPG